MSCCKVKKETSSSIKEFDILKRNFDEVNLEDLEDYRLLTLQNKANKPNYDYVVWLQVKVSYGRNDGYRAWSDSEILQSICKSISDWLPCLFDFEKSDTGKQLSLFNDDNNDDEEPLPPQPTKDSQWNSYWKKCNEIKKRNLMKKYSFFELCDLWCTSYVYKEHDYTHLLPQSSEAMIELVKEAIVKGTSSEKGYGRFDDYWWDDEYNYMRRDGALSDFEIFHRAICLTRLYLVPYKREFYVSTDLSYSSWEFGNKTEYRYWFDGRKINGSSWENSENFPEYDLYAPEFIDWLRNHFNVPYREVISDDDILRENIERFYGSIVRSEDNYDFKVEINKSKDWKEFKTKFLKIYKIDNGGGSGYSIDGFDASYSRDKKGNIIIKQNYEQRVQLNRNADDLPRYEYDDEQVVVFNISGDEIFKKAYELFHTTKNAQTNIFDFLAA